MAIGSPAHALEVDGFTDLRKQVNYAAGGITINVARHSGYCWGVQRAYDQTIAQAAVGDEKVSTFGPLIHNPQTIEGLRRQYGVDILESPDEFTSGKVIVRTHGVPLETQKQLRDKGAEVIDATCPYVRVSQNHARNLHKDKYHVVIIGDPKHPEVKSIMSYAQHEGTVVKTPADVANIPKGIRRIGVVVQSTMILSIVNEIMAKLMEITAELRAFNTICYVTDERQADAEAIAKENEFVVVIGGAQSSNTKKLAVVAEKFGARTQLIEGPEQLKFEEFGEVEKIGVLAGASTPNWLIDQVVSAIQEHFEH